MKSLETVQFIQTTPEEFKKSLLTDLEGALKNLVKQLAPKQHDELMTRNQVAEYLKISLVTLWNWTKEGKLKSYSIANKIYYKRHEIEQALTEL